MRTFWCTACAARASGILTPALDPRYGVAYCESCGERTQVVDNETTARDIVSSRQAAKRARREARAQARAQAEGLG